MILDKIWKTTPEEIYNGILRRFFKSPSWDYSLGAVLKSQKHLKYQNLIDRWFRYCRVMDAADQNEFRKGLDFHNKHILEIGCGPLLGWGPLAIFLGASRFTYHEPFLQRAVLGSEQMRKAYFLPFYGELVVNFGLRMGFQEFYHRTLSAVPLNFENSENIEIALSNSVLEHVSRKELTDLLSKINEVCRPKSFFFHCVDFGSHGVGGTRFGTLYKRKAGEETRFLNMMRKTEIANSIEAAGGNILAQVTYQQTLCHRDEMDKSWQAYDDDDLFSRVVFFLGETP